MSQAGSTGAVASAAEVVAHIRSGDRVWIHPGCAAPTPLVRALVQRGQELEGVEILHLLTFGPADYVEDRFRGRFAHTAMFVGKNVRAAVNDGRATFVPIHLSEVPAAINPDVVLLQLSPPGPHGYCSLGIGVDCTLAALKSADRVLAMINPNMPMTYGDGIVSLKELTAWCEIEAPLEELSPPPPTAVEESIGEHVAGLVEDGATLQLGIGGIPNAVLAKLGGHKDLGVHTEMFSDGLIPLIESGVVNGRRKTIHPRVVVTSFVLGTRRLYDFIHHNLAVRFLPTEYVNDPFVIARNHKMVSINSALEVDLYGQVAASTLGTRIISGFGGQVDFVRGAHRSPGGLSIIALPSTAARGACSRIVSTLSPGAMVTTPAADVDTVVTEYGVAELHGRSRAQRARALIEIAHPEMRERLLQEAYELHVFREE